ncbi:lipid II flippase MurJ [Trueperella sp. LYQ143]|uniref:lipid II flippase MurJ n=1 Tax=Trueperella sp. LYQ143 TaxID=3391059 RepID=UPI00398336EF
MFLGTLTSRVLGMVRSPILLGAVVGLTSSVSNSFDVANSAPNLLYMVIAGGLVNAVLVPAIVRAMKTSSDGGQAFINKLLTLSIVVLGALTILIALCAPIVVKLFAASMQPQWYRLTVLFAYWCLPQIFFYGMYTIFGQILNARENFGPYMWAPVLNNVVAIAGLLLMLALFGSENAASPSTADQWMGWRACLLGGVSTLGIIIQALVLVIPMRRLGIHFRPDFRWRGSGLGKAGRASTWMMATMITGLFSTMVQTNVCAGATARASRAGMELAQIAGNYAYTTAYAAYSLPTSLITVSITTAVFTRLARSAISENMKAVRADTSLTLRTVSMFNALATAALIVLAIPLSRLLVPSVSATDIVTLSRVLVVMSCGLVGVGAATVFNKVYYALEDTRTAFFVSLPWQIFGFLGFIVCGFLPPRWVTIGVGIVMASANIFSGFVTYYLLHRRLGGLELRRDAITHSKLLVIGILTGIIGWLPIRMIGSWQLASSLSRSLLAFVGVGAMMCVVFLILMAIFRMPETYTVIGYLRRLIARFTRRGTPPTNGGSPQSVGSSRSATSSRSGRTYAAKTPDGRIPSYPPRPPQSNGGYGSVHSSVTPGAEGQRADRLRTVRPTPRTNERSRPDERKYPKKKQPHNPRSADGASGRATRGSFAGGNQSSSTRQHTGKPHSAQQQPERTNRRRGDQATKSSKQYPARSTQKRQSSPQSGRSGESSDRRSPRSDKQR